MKLKTSQLKSYIGQTVTIHLTLEVLRQQKHVLFLIEKDASGSLQLVVKRSEVEGQLEISQLLPGSVFSATGQVIEAKKSKTYGLELLVESIVIHSKSKPKPITEESSYESRMSYRVVDLKEPKRQLMLKIRSAFEHACREFLYHYSFTEIHTPKLMGQASESGSQVFKVDYFDEKAYLAQSPQFYKQMAIASGLESVFEIGPVFRAEESHSSRHMTEFTGLDVEFAWCFEIQEVMTFEEKMLIYALSKMEPYKQEVFSLFGVEMTTTPTVEYISLDEAKQLLKEYMSLSKEKDLPDEGERLLYEILGKDMIFVVDYPIAKRPFYHMQEKEKGTTKSFDLIFKGIEITTGALREHRLDVLERQASEKKIKLESLGYYLDSFKYGCPPHGGFGLGLERVIMKLLGLSSVKEVSIVPRDLKRLVP